MFVVSGSVLFGYKKYSDGKLEHPLVHEAIELLRKEK
jgi:hypothetical protein